VGDVKPGRVAEPAEVQASRPQFGKRPPERAPGLVVGRQDVPVLGVGVGGRGQAVAAPLAAGDGLQQAVVVPQRQACKRPAPKRVPPSV
jgi:hypothetical protein